MTAFYINLAERLNRECNLTSQPSVNYIDIMKVWFLDNQILVIIF